MSQLFMQKSGTSLISAGEAHVHVTSRVFSIVCIIVPFSSLDISLHITLNFDHKKYAEYKLCRRIEMRSTIDWTLYQFVTVKNEKSSGAYCTNRLSFNKYSSSSMRTRM